MERMDLILFIAGLAGVSTVIVLTIGFVLAGIGEMLDPD